MGAGVGGAVGAARSGVGLVAPGLPAGQAPAAEEAAGAAAGAVPEVGNAMGRLTPSPAQTVAAAAVASPAAPSPAAYPDGGGQDAKPTCHRTARHADAAGGTPTPKATPHSRKK